MPSRCPNTEPGIFPKGCTCDSVLGPVCLGRHHRGAYCSLILSLKFTDLGWGLVTPAPGFFTYVDDFSVSSFHLPRVHAVVADGDPPSGGHRTCLSGLGDPSGWVQVSASQVKGEAVSFGGKASAVSLLLSVFPFFKNIFYYFSV